MPAYKDEQRGTWYCQFYYEDWQGIKKKKQKRGFKTKKEALEWESNFKFQWQNTMREKGFAQTYLRMIQNQITALFTHASNIYNLANNPCKKVKKMGKADADKIDFWTKAEYDKFIETFEVGSRYYVLFEILFWTGCREGELLALTKSDIDFANNKLHISKTYYSTERKDIITAPKTEQSVRTIDIPEYEIDEACYERMELLAEQMKAGAGITEELKASDQMKWVGLMNNVRSVAEEILVKELIYV